MAQENPLAPCREQIDNIDKQLAKLFEQRMKLSLNIADIKRQNNIAITDCNREAEIIANSAGLVDSDFSEDFQLLMRSIMALSKKRQRQSLLNTSELLPHPQKQQSDFVKCVFQGVSGAWSEQALINIFPEANRKSLPYFEDVFLAIKSQDARYGVLPIENSQSGAIGEVYDLLRKYRCFIVGQTWIDIQHCLMAKEGVALSDIKEVYSHPEGFRQCHNFLKNRDWNLNPASNTAVSAQIAQKAQNNHTAAIASKQAAKLYQLSVFPESIIDDQNNKTRFVVIANQPEYDQSSDIISFTFSTSHRSGALCEALMPLMAADANLTRIESRPAPGGNYRFFADINGNITDINIVSALKTIAACTDYFEVLGCYHQV